MIVSDAGYDVTRLAWVLRDLPVEPVGRVRSHRVMRLPKTPRMHGADGRPPSTARNSASPNRRPGPSLPSPRSRTPPTTARPKLRHGNGSTPGSPTAPHGWTTKANCPWLTKT
nr:transposase [Streptomyces sp. TSRI0281]